MLERRFADGRLAGAWSVQGTFNACSSSERVMLLTLVPVRRARRISKSRRVSVLVSPLALTNADKEKCAFSNAFVSHFFRLFVAPHEMRGP